MFQTDRTDGTLAEIGRTPCIGMRHRTQCRRHFLHCGTTETSKYDRLHIVMGMVNDKDISGVLSMMPKDAIYYFTRADVKRALPENELQALAQQVGLQGQSYPNVKAAVEAAKHILVKRFILSAEAALS